LSAAALPVLSISMGRRSARMNISRESGLHTDEASWYKSIGKEFADHQTVTHSLEEYVRGNVTTNTRGHLYEYLFRLSLRFGRNAS